jgi:hypothetical protein
MGWFFQVQAPRFRAKLILPPYFYDKVSFIWDMPSEKYMIIQFIVHLIHIINIYTSSIYPLKFSNGIQI